VTEILLHLLVASIFLESLTAGPVSVGRVLAVVTVYAVLLVIVSNPFESWRPNGRVAVPAVLFATWTGVSLVWADSASGWVSSIAQLAVGLCYFVGFMVLPTSRAQLQRVLLSMVGAAALSSVLGLVQAPHGRAVGLQGDPNTYAMYVLGALPVAVWMAGRSYGLPRVGWWIVTALLAAGAVAAQSRGALVAGFVLSLWLLWYGGTGPVVRPGRPHRLYLGLGSLIVLIGVLFTRVPRFDLSRAEQDGGTGRTDIWFAAWDAWQRHPILGIGSGSFHADSEELLSRSPGVQLNPHSAIFQGIKVHNTYLEAMVDLGPLGLILVVALLAGIFTVLARASWQPYAGVLRACPPMLLTLATAVIFISASTNKLLWILAGIAAALPRLAGEDTAIVQQATTRRVR
jgi:O-antigen ligase